MLEFMQAKRRFNLLKFRWETVFYIPKKFFDKNQEKQHSSNFIDEPDFMVLKDDNQNDFDEVDIFDFTNSLSEEAIEKMKHCDIGGNTAFLNCVNYIYKEIELRKKRLDDEDEEGNDVKVKVPKYPSAQVLHF